MNINNSLKRFLYTIIIIYFNYITIYLGEGASEKKRQIP